MGDRRKALLASLGKAPRTQLEEPQMRAKPTRTASMLETLNSPYGKFGALEPGNIDLTARPHVKNPDGSTSTVYSMGTEINGQQYLIPLVHDDGYIMTPDEGIAEFERTGKHLGVYGSPEESDQAAEAIHLDQVAHPPRNTLLDAMHKQSRRRRGPAR